MPEPLVSNQITPPIETPPVKPVEQATPVQEPAQPTHQEPTQQQPDIKDIEEKVSKSVLTKIAEALGLNKKEEAKLPTDPNELAKFIQENARKGTEEVLTQREQAEQKARQDQEAQTTEGATRFQNLWKTQFEQLAEAGKVPKIVNAEDKNDQGNIAKVRLLTQLKKMIDENAAKGIDYVPTLKEVFYEHPEVLTTATTIGTTAPISGGGRATINNQGGLSYKELHNTNIEDLIKVK